SSPRPLVSSSFISPPPPSLSSFFPYPPLSPSAASALSLRDALPIFTVRLDSEVVPCARASPSPSSSPLPSVVQRSRGRRDRTGADRKSIRLNSSHDQISYAVFCLKKKKKKKKTKKKTKNIIVI